MFREYPTHPLQAIHDPAFVHVYSPLQTSCLALACFCSLVSFAAMADSGDYADAEAFKFSLASGVIVWAYTLIVLGVPSAKLLGISVPGMASLESNVKVGNRIALWFAYSGAIACSAVSSDISKSYCKNSFCSKVYASCTFSWLATTALLLAVLDKDSTVLEQFGLVASGKEFSESPYATHTNEGAPPTEEYATPPSADL